MAPKLRVLISSGSSTKPTVSLPVNSAEPTLLKTDSFDGSIQVWVKGFEGDNKAGDGKEYFESTERAGMTYAIVVRGRFLDQVNADDLLFGNTFERPIRDSLPWGTSIATKAMHFVEPTLQMDLYADKPWALSYALSSMNHLSVLTAPPASEPSGPFIAEQTLDWIQQEYKGEGALPQAPEGDEKACAVARKKWFSNEANRKDVTVDKNTYMGMEFCNGYLDFNTLSLSLPAQFNMSFPLLKYWDGQPVTYSCQRRGTDGKLPGGKVFWQVAFEIVDEEAKKELEKRGGKVDEGTTSGEAANTKSTQEENNDDVD